tara:strand:- start:13 stop:675 length:663 start_codon:yes stop_codon:yes gene_type:complete
MQLYSNYGFKDFIICLGYKGEVIKDFFINYQNRTRDCKINLSKKKISYFSDDNCPDWNITLINTGLHTMTGGRISKIRKYIDDESFMLTYGDGISDININNLLSFHKSHNKILTVTGVRPPGRFGEMLENKDGQVIEFNEKPQSEKGRISGGFFVANSDIFSYLNDNEELIFEREPIERLVKDKQLMMYKHDGFWQPMDTSREYNLLNNLYEKERAPWIK